MGRDQGGTFFQEKEGSPLDPLRRKPLCAVRPSEGGAGGAVSLHLHARLLRPGAPFARRALEGSARGNLLSGERRFPPGPPSKKAALRRPPLGGRGGRRGFAASPCKAAPSRRALCAAGFGGECKGETFFQEKEGSPLDPLRRKPLCAVRPSEGGAGGAVSLHLHAGLLRPGAPFARRDAERLSGFLWRGARGAPFFLLKERCPSQKPSPHISLLSGIR